tara:strand:- start:2388 stop:3239 length:852 start_codon:yes stop_codon:yes gene_type:complete
MLWRYVSGNKLEHAIIASKNLINKNYLPIINYISESAKNKNDIISNKLEYEEILKNIRNNHISNNDIHIAIKLSQFSFNETIIENVVSMFYNENIKVLLDAENNEYYDRYNNISNILINNYNSNKVNIIKTYQMYRRDSYNTLLSDIIYFNKNNKYHGIKLVRGAYYYREKYYGNLYNDINDTHNNYNKAIYLINNTKNTTECILATHNDISIKKALNIMSISNDYNKFSFANLYGMNNYITRNNIKNIKKMVYIPYGAYKEIIPYLSRRLYENNSMIRYMFN